MDGGPLALFMVCLLVGLIVFILLLGQFHPKSGAQILDWKPTRSPEALSTYVTEHGQFCCSSTFCLPGVAFCARLLTRLGVCFAKISVPRERRWLSQLCRIPWTKWHVTKPRNPITKIAKCAAHEGRCLRS